MSSQPSGPSPWLKALMLLMAAMAGTFCGGATGLAGALRERGHRIRPPAANDVRRGLADEARRLTSTGFEGLLRLRAR